MRRRRVRGAWIACPLLALAPVGTAHADDITGLLGMRPASADALPLLLLTGPPDPPSVYAPPEPERPDDLTNRGGVNVDLNFRYLTDYVYRGISFNGAVYTPPTAKTAQKGKLHASNFQADGQLTFDLGKLPHPFVAVMANLNDSDPLSRFQEIRPSAGFEYNLRPVGVEVGINAYIYPERETVDRTTDPHGHSPNTSEVYVRLTFDDTFFLPTEEPILTPYVYAAYDYALNDGWYLETGFKHDFKFPDQGASISPYFDVAYVSHYKQIFTVFDDKVGDSGFQHYDVGLIGLLSLNHLLTLPPRFGTFAIEGDLTYTGRFGNPIRSNSELWGGVGLTYHY
jgi:hypothetical protein